MQTGIAMKQWKPLVRTAAFLLVFCLIFIHVQELLTPKYTWPEKSTRIGDTVKGIYAEPADSVQVLWVGASHMRCGVSPMVLYRESGIRSYNLAIDGRTLAMSYSQLKIAMRQMRPKFVVLDMSGAFLSEAQNRKEPAWRTVLDSISWFRLPDRFDMSKDMVETNRWSHADMIDGLFPLVRYHTRYLLGSEDYLKTFEREKLNFMKGYSFVTTIKGAKKKSATVLEDGGGDEAVTVAFEQNKPCIRAIMDLCARSGCELILTKIPVYVARGRYHSYWDAQKHQMVADLADELGCRFVDLNDQDIGLDWRTDTKDGGKHLNTLGANKVSRFFAEWFSRNAELETDADPAQRESWNRQLALYEAEERYYDLKMEADFDGYLDRVSVGDYTLVLTSTGLKADDFSTGTVDRMNALFGDGDRLFADGDRRHVYLAVGSKGERIAAETGVKSGEIEGVFATGTGFAATGDSAGTSATVGKLDYATEKKTLRLIVYDNGLRCVVDSICVNVNKGKLTVAHDAGNSKTAFRRALAKLEESVLKDL